MTPTAIALTSGVTEILIRPSSSTGSVSALVPPRNSEVTTSSKLNESVSRTATRMAGASSGNVTRWNTRRGDAPRSVATARLDELLREEISEVIRREVDDPRIGFVTITDVEVSPDLRHANVWVSVIGTADERKQSLRALSRRCPSFSAGWVGCA